MRVMFAPGGRCAISPIARRPSSRRNHSMWVTPLSRPRASIAAKPIAARPLVLGPRDVLRQEAAPTGSRGSRAPRGSSGRYCEMEYARGWPAMVSVSKLSSWPRSISSASTGLSALAPMPAMARSRFSRLLTRNVDFAPMPAGGLSTIGKPTSSANDRASCSAVMRRLLATPRPACRSAAFIRDLSRNRSAVAGRVPGTPKCSRACAMRHHQGLEDARRCGGWDRDGDAAPRRRRSCHGPTAAR